MAWTWVLVAGTTTLNLNDTTNFHVNVGGFQAPPPRRLTSYSGGNLMRYGADLLEASWENRTVGMNLTVRGTNAAGLGSNIGSLWNILRMAEEWSKDGLGTQMQLRYQMEGQTGTYLFDVIEGSLDMGADLHGPYLLKGTRAQHAILTLECKPFVTQPGETLQNFLKDPSFEVAATPLADWSIDGTGGGTVYRSATAGVVYGTAALFLQLTATGDSVLLSQAILTTAFASGSAIAWSLQYKKNFIGTFELALRLRNAAGTQLSFNQAPAVTGTAAAFTVYSGTLVPTGSVGTIGFELRLNPGGNATALGTMVIDGCILCSGTLPVAWISGRDVANHFDNNGQAHINYVDIFGVPGDVPAAAQVKILESEAHSELWAGARHDARMTGTGLFLEGENFTGTIGPWTSTANSTASNGSIGLPTAAVGGGPFPAMTSTSPSAPQVAMLNIASPPVGQFRTLARVTQDGNTGTIFIGLGYQYGSVTKDPSTTAHYKSIGTLAGSFTYFDLGVITIPPVRTPDGGTVGTLGIRFAYYASSMTANIPTLDHMLLMPVDFGGAYVSKTSAADNLWMDSKSRPEGVYRVSTADVVQSYPPNQVGNPPTIHPKGSRLYFTFGSGTVASSVGHGAIVSVSYVPRYLFVGT